MTQKTSSILTSPTLISALIVILASVASLCGVEITSEEQAALDGHLLSAVSGAAGLFVIGRNIYAKRKNFP